MEEQRQPGGAVGEILMDDRSAAEGCSGYVQRYPSLHTTELDTVEALASRLFTPHRLQLSGRRGRVDSRLSAARIGAMTVGYLSYGAEVRLVHESVIGDYHINIPLSGHAESWCGSESVRGTPAQATVFLPERPAGIKWAADCAQLCVKFRRADLELEVEGLLGRPVAKPLDFPASMDLTTRASRTWLSLLSVLNRDLAHPDSMLRYPMIGRRSEHLIMDYFLLQQPAYHHLALGIKEQPAPPRTIRAALDFMEAHPEDPLTTTDLARELGISARALQEGFKRHVGMPPLTYLREVRLSRVHAELEVESPDSVTVARTAIKWGFSHLGRFGVAYRRKFGVTPHQTLRATRRSA